MTRHPNLPEPKPAHAGPGAIPFGRRVWLLGRNDGVLIGPYRSRHEAIGAAATFPGGKEDWYEPVSVPVGSVPLSDVRAYA